MSADMTIDFFARYPFGKIALEKISKLKKNGIPDNFRLFEAGWVGNTSVMRVTGAEFRVARTGPNKGKLAVMIPKTKQTVYVTAEEISSYT